MSRANTLAKKQRVIDDLFNGNGDEQAVLQKHRISTRVFNKWLADDDFREMFDQRIEAAYRQSRLIIARYAPLAAAKLLELTESEKEETARKACLDIIESKSQARPKTPANTTEHTPSISSSRASKLLAALAKAEENQ